MKIIIDIPEEWFCRLQNEWGWALAENVREAIKSGTILPKGHGRLIDADALLEQFRDGTEGYDCVAYTRYERANKKYDDLDKKVNDALELPERG